MSTSPQPFALRRRRVQGVFTLALLLSSTGGLSCSQDDDDDKGMQPNPGPQPEALGPGSVTAPLPGEMAITIPFAAQVHGQEIRCGQRFSGIGTANSDAEFGEFAMYLYDLQLKNELGVWVPLRMQDDGRWQSQGVALLDFLDHASPTCVAQGSAETHKFISGYIAQGNYSAIRFSLGVPGSLNHIDASTAVSPFNRPRMWWTWTRGFRYLKADLSTWTTRQDASVVAKERYYLHSGADKCTTDAATGQYVCADPRLVQVEFPYNQASQGVLVDVAKLFSRDNLSEGRGCMGAHSLKDPKDPKELVPQSCVGHYLSMGLDTSGEAAVPTGAQDLFSAVPWAGQRPAIQNVMPLAQADTKEGRRDITLWPRPDYVRPPELDAEGSISAHLLMDSHPLDDARSLESCSNCHQTKGPGKGIYSFAGTILRENGQPYNEGFVEIVASAEKGSRFEKDPSKKLVNAKVHMKVPIDGYGQFYATHDFVQQYAAQNAVAPLDFVNNSYQAYVVNRDGHRVMAMAIKTTGSCNHCHDGGFKLVIPDRLVAGPWTPAPM